MLLIDSIVFFKKSNTMCTVSVKMASKVGDFWINKIQIDMNDASEPIKYYKVDNEYLLSGSFFELLKRQIVKIFATVPEAPGLYTWSKNQIK